MIYVTSDLHGRFDCLLALLKKVNFQESDWLYIIGDVIDRNSNGGVDILKWLLYAPNAELILGNHEAMLLSNSWIFEEITDNSLNMLDSEKLHMLSEWQKNGAQNTIAALSKEDLDTRQDILEYLREAPLYDSVSIGGKNFLLVHGGLGNYRDDRPINDYAPDELLLERPYPETRYSNDYITVIGHTPTNYYSSEYRGKILKTDTWVDIDTGAANGLSPSLLRLDDMAEFYL